MMKWSSRPPTAATKRFHVKVKPLKLEGFGKEMVDEETEKSVAVQMKWNRPNSVFVPIFYLSSSSSSSKRPSRQSTGQSFLRKGGESIEWDDGFESLCDFSIASNDGSFSPWDVSFTVLYGENAESKNKMSVLGKASLNLAELATNMESEVERKLPVTSKVEVGVPGEATLTLLVSVSFAEVRNSQESTGLVQNSAESGKGDAFFKKMMGLTGGKKKKKGTMSKGKTDRASFCESDESTIVDSDGSPGNKFTISNDTNDTELSLGSGTETELGPSPSPSPSPGSEAQIDPVKKDGFFSWKRRRLSLGQSKKKGGPLTEKANDGKVGDDVDGDVDRKVNSCSSVDSTTSASVAAQNGEAAELSSENESGNWEFKEVVSRDGHTKLRANVFFASFDQRSEQAAGESACTALVAVIAHWLHSNQDFMPTRQEYNRLITQGSSDWRMLCNNETYINFFPDKHFDLETVLEAGLHPINILPNKSFTGFFSPEKFESLREAMSFDKIWDEINGYTEDCPPGIYIVSWNDHFFVLKAEADAYYIFDSLGERLFEGCNQAYILKFDDTTSMYGKVPKEDVIGSEEKAKEDKASSQEDSEERLIYSGKECCKEYIKRFLAAIPLAELEIEEKKGTVSTFSLLQRLQIDFHYSSSRSSSVSTSSSSSTATSNFFLSSSEE